ncbi:MAG TPA: hypothetical protein PLZ45_06880 [Ferruginibacter sp.]|nr:hypothetical protein [Ferruginibacter sp.]
MVKKIISLALLTALLQTGIAQTPDKNINKLCGCFEVEFKYAETFSPDPNYKFHEREIINGGLEYVFPVEAGNKRIVLQHLLVITDSMIIKHWREDWTYENPVIWKYRGNKTWIKEMQKPEAVKGKWTQSIWEVSDEPRYQGTSEWINANGETFWLNSTDAPLPRREYSVRNDYNILNRTNRLVVSGNGYIHQQDNKKIFRENGIDKLLVEEKGINSYARKDEAACAAAKAWWEKNKLYWEKVRSTWEEKIAALSTIKLETKVNGKVLHEYLMAQAKEYAEGKIPAAELDGRIKQYIDQFLNASKTKETADPKP